jgi:transcriptional regulator with XRE-family HTH domain
MTHRWLALKVARARAGLTQFDLALRAGLPESRVAKFETGRQRPTAEELSRLAGALGVDTEELSCYDEVFPRAVPS